MALKSYPVIPEFAQQISGTQTRRRPVFAALVPDRLRRPG